MKSAEKNLQKQPLVSPPNPERRRFLRTVLFTGAAFASGCKSPNKDSTTTARIFQNRAFSLGDSSIVLKECNDAAQTATFEVSKPGSEGLPDSVTLRVPGSFTVSASQHPVSGAAQYDVYVERISCNTNPQSANVSISAKPFPAENSENQVSPLGDLPVIGMAIALFGAVALWVVHRRGQEGREGALLSPKRH